MSELVYKMGDLRRLIMESSGKDFSPVLGKNVEKDNKSNNEKTYKEIKKKVNKFDGGLGEEKKSELPPKEDYNRTTLDFNPRTEPDKAYKEKIEAQAKGYTSKLEQDNGIEKAAQFDKDGKILKQFKGSSDKINKEKSDLAHAGLTANKLPKAEPNTLYENNVPKPKRLRFSRTHFLDEAQMLARIPEEYKVNGQKIYMVDAHDNEYIVECTQSKFSGAIETNIISHTNKTALNEQMKRINELFQYKSDTTSGRNSVIKQDALNEEQQFKKLMDKVRGK